ncbi:hypothetical protein OIO90_004649 [Microbotryomycetes sp. JL221]|nr:hypothetical protein OIO90_004649 [Microbotryomycetes sp. JL221]
MSQLPGLTAAQSLLEQLWTRVGLPAQALDSVTLSGPELSMPSSFNVTALAQATIAVCALAASHIDRIRSTSTSVDNDTPWRQLKVDSRDASAEFRVERLATIGGRQGQVWDKLAGTYRARAKGWLRPHVNWAHHRLALLDMLGLPQDTMKIQLAKRFLECDAFEISERALSKGLLLTALRSFDEDNSNHGLMSKKDSASRGPIRIDKLDNQLPKPFPPLVEKCKPLEGIRVLDMTRVIAGPTAGRTLAVTAEHLPALPELDFETSRGKRTIQLDLRPENRTDRVKFEQLVQTADVILQAYRPGALEGLGYGEQQLRQINPDIVYASLNAWGHEGLWKHRRGFDSLVQFASGINEAEGQAWKQVEANADNEFEPKALPCQALDHAAGYLLAFGVQTALARRAEQGGSYKVTTSLLDVAYLLRSLGRVEPTQRAFNVEVETLQDLSKRAQTMQFEHGFDHKAIETVRHAAKVDGLDLNVPFVATSYHDAEAVWLTRAD